MRYETLYDGTQLPVIGLGTARIGDRATATPPHMEPMISVLRQALRMGYTHIDTAELYGGGRAEVVVGHAIESFPREGLFITTKVAPARLAYDTVLEALNGSLGRLNTTYVDMYLIHAPNPEVPLGDTLRALEELVHRRQVRYIGVSNFGKRELQEAVRLSHLPIAVNQVHYSLAARDPEVKGVLTFCRDHEILVAAHSPLEHGRLLRNTTLQQVAQRRGATAAQVALAWLIRQPGMITIPMSTNEDHLRQNLGALNVELDADDLRALDTIAR